MSGGSNAGAAAHLMRDRDAIAAAVTARLYEERPDLIDRHGERGREKCLQDMRYNVDHLIPAVDMADDAMFVRYVEWLDGMLRAHGVETRDVVRCLELLRDETNTRMPADQAAVVDSAIGAGLQVLVKT